jgi:hypothetical protein
MAKDNANPTILSVSELPSHRAKRNRNQAPKKQSIADVLSAPPSYAMDPFYMSEFSEDSDDSSIEPIDEQEIYGKSRGEQQATFNAIVDHRAIPPNMEIARCVSFHNGRAILSFCSCWFQPFVLGILYPQIIPAQIRVPCVVSVDLTTDVSQTSLHQFLTRNILCHWRHWG